MMKRYKKLLITTVSIFVIALAALVNASAASVATGAASVSCAALNVRTGADQASQVTTMLQKGDTVVILDKTNDGWYHISEGDTIGYVAAKYISDISPVKDFTASGSLTGSDITMRSTPSTDGTLLGTYSAGAVMSVIGIDNGWFKVTNSGQTGYIRSDFMKLTASAALAAAAADTASVPDVIESVPDTAESEGQEIAAFAEQFVGYRYIWGASSPSVGFDCSGLTSYVYGEFGYSISRTAADQYYNNGTEVSKSDLQPGDLLFFSSNGGASITHVGLYIGDGNFVNASSSKTGVIISSISSSWYAQTYYGAKRIVG